ncbi:hypothetical protein M378DRAFT_848208 [Amanita muscaria Koide BX008]|uniref:Uncharacterized protein n=1 Tax=Amanita muscaria (strain Koide BX008) TaxID=946122 RepID=A0A0C2T535_AMAMK|nr:hypothetical protein M378DRAFT_848208 [Amanita muscaria Koide BX008]
MQVRIWTAKALKRMKILSKIRLRKGPNITRSAFMPKPGLYTVPVVARILLQNIRNVKVSRRVFNFKVDK